jgi:hypothetical protein
VLWFDGSGGICLLHIHACGSFSGLLACINGIHPEVVTECLYFYNILSHQFLAHMS